MKLIDKIGGGKQSMPQIGNVRCGIKTEAGLPRSIDYFVFSGEYADVIRQAHGERPSKLPIVFLTDDEKSYYVRYELWGKDARKYADFDGEQGVEWNGSSYQPFTVDSEVEGRERCKAMAGMHKAKWKGLLVLKFIILNIPVYGLWKLQTSGMESSIPNIVSILTAVKNELSGRPNTFAGMPFDLLLTMAKSTKPESKSKYPVLSLVPSLSAENIAALEEMKDVKGLLTESKINERKDNESTCEEVQ